MDTRLVAEYRKNRAWQLETYGDSPLRAQNADGVFVSARQFVGGGAAYGEHAYAAYMSARRHIAFIDELKAKNRLYRKRSAAAKRGWKKRRNTKR